VSRRRESYLIPRQGEKRKGKIERRQKHPLSLYLEFIDGPPPFLLHAHMGLLPLLLLLLLELLLLQQSLRSSGRGGRGGGGRGGGSGGGGGGAWYGPQGWYFASKTVHVRRGRGRGEARLSSYIHRRFRLALGRRIGSRGRSSCQQLSVIIGR